MTYLVMECHPAYAVVLDETGRFIKTANMGYRTGQRLTEITEFTEEERELPVQKKRRRPAAALAIAACLCLVLVTSWNQAFTAYGTVRLRINPEVLLTVSRSGYVIDAQGVNEEGVRLLRDFHSSFRKADEAAGQLVQRAEELGFLKEDKTVQVTVTSRNRDWSSAMEEDLMTVLEESTDPMVQVVPVCPEDEEDADEDVPEAEEDSDEKDPEDERDSDEEDPEDEKDADEEDSEEEDGTEDPDEEENDPEDEEPDDDSAEEKEDDPEDEFEEEAENSQEKSK